MRTLFVLLFLLVSTQVWAEYGLLRESRPFRVQQRDRVVAFGDIHGDYVALVSVLRGAGIIDEKENWIAKNTVVVSMGDLLDRGQQSRQVMELLMKLEKQTADSQSQMVTLLGNHELLVTEGQLSYFNPEDAAKNYTDFRKEDDESLRTTIRNAFSGDSHIAKWIASRPTAIVIDKTLFIHAGIEEWAADMDWGRLNETMHAWVLYLQGNGPKPPEDTKWVLKDNGPIWTRELAMSHVYPAKYNKWLDAAGLERVVVGHSVVPRKVPVIDHAMYGGKFVMIDTGMSFDSYGGRPSAIEWKTGEPIRALTFDRLDGKGKIQPKPEAPMSTKARLEAKVKAEKEASSESRSLWKWTQDPHREKVERCIRLLTEGPDL